MGRLERDGRDSGIVGAIAAAVAMQELMAVRNDHLPAERAMQFRLGLPMGDGIADDDEVFGDGVNVAVRLEAVAWPGGVALSAKASQEASKHLSIALVCATSTGRIRPTSLTIATGFCEPACRSPSSALWNRRQSAPLSGVHSMAKALDTIATGL
jgi:hypothetical protein